MLVSSDFQDWSCNVFYFVFLFAFLFRKLSNVILNIFTLVIGVVNVTSLIVFMELYTSGARLAYLPSIFNCSIRTYIFIHQLSTLLAVSSKTPAPRLPVTGYRNKT